MEQQDLASCAACVVGTCLLSAEGEKFCGSACLLWSILVRWILGTPLPFGSEATSDLHWLGRSTRCSLLMLTGFLTALPKLLERSKPLPSQNHSRDHPLSARHEALAAATGLASGDRVYCIGGPGWPFLAWNKEVLSRMLNVSPYYGLIASKGIPQDSESSVDALQRLHGSELKRRTSVRVAYATCLENSRRCRFRASKTHSIMSQHVEQQRALWRSSDWL